MGTLHDSYPAVREDLTSHYGRASASPPAPSPGGDFGRLARVLLGRSVADRKRDVLLTELSDAGLLDPPALAEADPSELAQVATSGGVRVAAKVLGSLRRLARWVVDHGGMDNLAGSPTESLRDELRALPGVGPGAADALLLHALDRPAYPIDRATYRVLVRHAWIDTTADYDEARDLVERLGPDSPSALVDLAAWMERLGSDFCRPSVARCEGCPLRPFLPESGPREPDG